MLEMKVPVAEKYSMLIKHLKRCQRDFLMPKESTQLSSDLLAFIHDIVAEINDTNTSDTAQALTTPFLAIPETWTFVDLFQNAYALLLYREYLGIIALHQTQYNNDYIAFCETQKILNTALKESNPFILHEHLIHIHNLVAHHRTTTQHPDLPIPTLEIYQRLLLQIKALITEMDFDTFGSFSLYLKVLADYSLSHATLEASQDDGLSFHTALLESTVRDTYVSMIVCKLFMREAQTQASSEEDWQATTPTPTPTEDQRKLNFYLIGKGLFDRTPFCSIAVLEKQLLSLSLMPTSTLVFSYDKAKEQLHALRSATSDLVMQEQQSKADQSLSSYKSPQ